MDDETEEHMPSVERLKELLLGKKILFVHITDEPPGGYEEGPTGYLTLSDNTTIKVWGNDGGCACSAGCYPLAHLAEVDNIITNVEVEEKPGGDDTPCRTCGAEYCIEDGHEEGYEGYYRIFVYAENEKINMASFEGSDGNGYYGTGWWLDVIDGPGGSA